MVNEDHFQCILIFELNAHETQASPQGSTPNLCEKEISYIPTKKRKERKKDEIAI